MTRLLIVTHEHIGPKMAGPGIRAWEISRALAEYGYEVTLATPYLEVEGATNIQILSFSWDDISSLETLIKKSDVMMTTGPLLSRIVRWFGKPLELPVIVDLYFIPEIEQVIFYAEKGSLQILDSLIETTLIYLCHGDFFICATKRQRDFWLGALWMAGRLNAYTVSLDPDEWIAYVPMGIPAVPPKSEGRVLKGVVPGISPEDKVVLWMGGVWEWTDPFTLAEAWKYILTKRSDVRLVFGSLQHYDQRTVPLMSKATRFLELCRELNWLGKTVFILDWIPYEQRGSYLLEADVGISLHDYPIEGRYAVRSRILDYLWASLPCVLTEGDELSDMLSDYGLAILVPPRDPVAVADALLSLLFKAPSRSELAARTEYLRKKLSWTAVVGPLLEFLKKPRFAPDAPMARGRITSVQRLREENKSLREEILHLRSHLDKIQQGRIVRLLNGIYRIFGKRFL